MQQQRLSRNVWVELPLETYKCGHYHSLEEARQLLGYADERSLRKLIKMLDVTLYANPLNRNFALISHQDLETVAAYANRSLAKETSQKAKTVNDDDVARQLAALQIQYAREVSDLERRVAIVEELRAQDAEVYEQRIVALQEKHDRIIAQLRETIKDLQGKLRAAIKGQSSETPRVSSESRSVVPRLPLGYEPLEAFADLHHVDLQTLKTAKALPVLQGRWRQGKALVSDVLDPAGQAIFYQIFHLSNGFQPCMRCQVDQHGLIADHESS